MKPQTHTQDKVRDSLTKLEVGISELLQSGNWERYLNMQAKFHKYSFRNTILILEQCPNATRIAGFNTWKDFNRFVKKGEKAIAILAPMIGKDKNDEDKKKLFGFKNVSVFDISQTDGEALPSVVNLLEGIDDQGILEKLLQVASSLSISTEFQTDIPMNGYCQYEGDKAIKIVIHQSRSVIQQCKTLAHELGHALLHNEESYRTHERQSFRELEAESVAFCVMKNLGIDTSDYSFGYIASWSKSKDDLFSQLKESGDRIQKAVSEILAIIEK